MQHLATILIAAAVCGGLLMAFGAGEAGAAEKEAAFTLTPDDLGMVLKTPDGRTVFRYMTKRPADTKLTANSVCCLYPVKTPSGEEVVDFAPSDHPHHRGVFLAWHATEGKKPADFWGWGEWAPTKDRVIKNRSVKLLKADAKHAELVIRNDWMAENEVAVEEALDIEASLLGGVYVVDSRLPADAQGRPDVEANGLRRVLRQGPQGRQVGLQRPAGRSESAQPAPPQARDRLAGGRLVRLHDRTGRRQEDRRRRGRPPRTIRRRSGTTSRRSPWSTRASWPQGR